VLLSGLMYFHKLLAAIQSNRYHRVINFQQL
jgi:hypothetical protein